MVASQWVNSQHNVFLSFFAHHQDKKSSKDYLENAVSGDKEDDFGSDGEENGTTEHVDDANAMGEFALLVLLGL